MFQLFADVSNATAFSWAALFTVIGALVYAAWNQWLKQWVVEKVDTIEDKIADKLKPYLGDDSVKVRKAMEDVEGVVLAMVDLVLARKFAGTVVSKTTVDKAVIKKALDKAMASEVASKDALGQKLYEDLDKVLQAMPTFVAPEDAINLLNQIEAHEKGEGEADVLAAVDEAKKVVGKK